MSKTESRYGTHKSRKKKHHKDDFMERVNRRAHYNITVTDILSRDKGYRITWSSAGSAIETLTSSKSKQRWLPSVSYVTPCHFNSSKL